MRTLLSAIAIAVALSATTGGQWLKHPTPGVPRTPDGAPDLNAPPPRTAEGLPDLSGIWKAEETRPCPPGGCDDMMIGEQFIDIGWGLPGGLPYQPWARELMQQRKARVRKDDPNTRCLPVGPVRMHTTPLYRRIVQIKGLLAILNERTVMYRQIFTDGRPFPRDPQPSWSGYSTGKWEGDTLVVQTSGFRDDLWLDANGSPMTSEAKMIERFHRPTFGKLEIDLTIDDPKAYTAPWTTRLNQFIVVDTELLDYVCVENEKDTPRFRN